MTLRVLHLDEQMGWRGGELQASWLMQGLARAGHKVFLAARPGSPMLQNPHGGATITRLPMALRSEFDLPSAWRLARFARANGVQIVHAHTSHSHSIALLCRLFYPALKVVVHRRVSFPPRRAPLNRWKYHAPDRIVCVSAAVQDVMLQYGLPPEKVELVHSAVDLQRLEVAPLPREELQVPADALLLFNAGSLVGHKDHATLLRAFAQVMAQLPHAWLVIAGEGTLRPELEALAKELAVENRVRFLGQRGDVPAITRAADLYVSSSWSEGLGTSVLEALAAGTPVVATQAGGVGEMVRDGETGWLIPERNPALLASTIIEALAHRDEAQKRARKGIARVHERFTVERMVEGNLAVYRSLS